MIVKGTKQLGNFKRGVNLYVPKRRSAAAPSGIPYSTSQIILSGFNDTNVGVDRTSPITLTKGISTPQAWASSGAEGYNVYVYRTSNTDPNETWFVMLQQFGEEGFGSVNSAANPSTTLSEVPTTGWVLASGVTGTITITAAWWTLNCYLLIV